MPVIDVMAGAFLGQVLQVLHDTIKKAKDRSSTTRCILDRLDATIFRITPLVVKVDKLMSEEVEDSQKKVIEALKHSLEQAGNLVEAYADLRRRNLIKKYRYKRRIKELETSINSMIDVDVQVTQWADIKELMAKMSEMNTKLDEIMRKPTDSPCLRMSHHISQSSNHNIVEATDQSSKRNDECSSNGSKPKMSQMNTKLDEIMRKPTDSPYFRKSHDISQGSNHNIVEATDQSSERNDECLSNGSKPKIDIHLRWSSRKRNKDREIRFTLK